MNIIYPVNIKKYIGSIYSRGGKYQASIKTIEYNMSKLFDEYDDAYEWIVNKNIELRLLVKNLVYVYDDHYEVELTQEKRTIIDKTAYSHDVIDDLIWYAHYNPCNKRFYAYGTEAGIKVQLHNKLLNGEMTVDHINHNGLDNRLANLVSLIKKFNQLTSV